MNKIINLSIHDFQIIYRDKILMIILFIPVLMIALLYWGIPSLMIDFPFLNEYYPLIVGVFCVVTAISPAYIISFIMLDEKDEDVLTVIRIMPIPSIHFITYRILFVLVFGFLTSFLMLSISNINFSAIYLFLISFLISLIAPISALVIITYSRNKIEGLTFLKGINFIIMLPVFSFFSGIIGKIALAIIPAFWIYHSLMTLDTPGQFLLFLSVGLIFNILILIFLINQFKKRIFQ